MKSNSTAIASRSIATLQAWPSTAGTATTLPIAYPAIARDVLKIPTKQFIIDAETHRY